MRKREYFSSSTVKMKGEIIVVEIKKKEEDKRIIQMAVAQRRVKPENA